MTVEVEAERRSRIVFLYRVEVLLEEITTVPTGQTGHKKCDNKET